MDNWSYKNRICETRLMDHLDENMVVYRGSLSMPKNSSPDSHVKTRKEFLRILNRWKSKGKYTVEVRGLLHITDPLNAHWDTLAYSNAPERPLKAAVADAWHRAGGKWRGWSIESCEHEELTATLKYQNKDTVNPDTARRYLPETKANMGMKFVWHTRPSKTSKGFWAGRSEGTLWQECIDEWYNKGQMQSGTAPILDSMFRTKQVARLRALTPYADDYLRAFPWHVPGTAQPSTSKSSMTPGELLSHHKQL